MDTALAGNLKIASEHIRYDKCAKKVIGNKSVAAWILKTCTRKFSKYDAEHIRENCICDVSIAESAVHQDHGVVLGGDDILGCLNSESTSINEGTVHFDVKFRSILPEDGENNKHGNAEEG